MRSALGHGLITATVISASFAKLFEVSVGLDGPPGRCAGIASFRPASIRAEPGDEVNFISYGENISLTQTEFDSPCQPINSGSSQSVSFPATGWKEGTVRLVLGPDYDGSPLRFLHGEEISCSPETIFTVNGPPPIEIPSTSGPPHCSHPPPQLTPHGTTLKPIVETFPGDHDVTDIVSLSTNAPPISVFASETLTPMDEVVTDGVASSPTTTSDELGATSTLTVAVLPHTTLVTERVFPRRSSESVGDGTGLRLEPSSSIVRSSAEAPDSSGTQGIMAVSPLLLTLLLWTASTSSLSL